MQQRQAEEVDEHLQDLCTVINSLKAQNSSYLESLLGGLEISSHGNKAKGKAKGKGQLVREIFARFGGLGHPLKPGGGGGGAEEDEPELEGGLCATSSSSFGIPPQVPEIYKDRQGHLILQPFRLFSNPGVVVDFADLCLGEEQGSGFTDFDFARQEAHWLQEHGLLKTSQLILFQQDQLFRVRCCSCNPQDLGGGKQLRVRAALRYLLEKPAAAAPTFAALWVLGTTGPGGHLQVLVIPDEKVQQIHLVWLRSDESLARLLKKRQAALQPGGGGVASADPSSFLALLGQRGHSSVGWNPSKLAEKGYLTKLTLKLYQQIVGQLPQVKVVLGIPHRRQQHKRGR